MKKIVLCIIAIANILISCSQQEDTPYNPEEVTVNISVSNWNDLTSRASSGMLTPATLLIMDKDGLDIKKKISLSGNSVKFTVGDGEYDVFAVCGLPASNIGEQLDDLISVKNNEQYVDFATGETTISVENRVCTPATLNIDATRQMAKLEVVVTEVPSYVRKLNLYVQGLCDQYKLDTGWSASTKAKSILTQIPIDDTTYDCTMLCAPCYDDNKVTYVAEIATTAGSTIVRSYTSEEPLSAGNILHQTIEFPLMALVEGDINIGDWSESNDEGSLDGSFSLSVGSQYFSQPATVYYNGGTIITLFPHKAMEVTLDEVRKWSDYSNISYDLLPEVIVSRWAMPITSVAPNNFLNAIGTIGLAGLNEQIERTGNEPLDENAENIIAYYDPTEGKFYRYDLTNMDIVEIEKTEDTFLFYPTGVVNITE